jgi:hypothetical protein
MKKVSAREAVVAALTKLGSASAKSLVSYTKKPKPQVATTLWKLKRDGKVSVKDGVYVLSGDNKSAAKGKSAAKDKTVLDGAYLDALEATLFQTDMKLSDAMVVIKYLEGKLGSVHA